jgi:peptide/nickel transport system substrate-binding protein
LGARGRPRHFGSAHGRRCPFTPVTDPTGSGPFIFVREEWVVGSRAVYRRNPDYVPRDEAAEGTAGGKRALVDRVEWLTIPDAQTAASALIQGELDFLETPQLDALPMLTRRGMITRVTNQLGFQGMIRPNHLFPPFDDVRARQALLYLVDQRDYLNVMFPDPSVGRECHAFFVCGGPLETEAGWRPSFRRDRAHAQQLMRDAGYDGRPIVLLQSNDPPFLNAATLLLADQLKAIGVNVDLQPMDFAAMANRRVIRRPPAEGGWHILLTYWNGLGASDPVGNVPMQTNGANAWPGWPSDEAHQALIDSYPYAPTVEARQALAARIQESAYRIVPYVQFAQWTAPMAYRPTLRGIIGAPQVLVLWNVEKKG